MKKKSEVNRDSFTRKYIYKFINRPKETLCIFKQESILSEKGYYKIIKSKDLYLYLSKNKKENLILIKYYEIENFDLSLLNDYIVTKNIYEFQNINKLYEIIQNKYNNNGKYPLLNIGKNKSIQCTLCNYLPISSDDLVKHLYDCRTYQYTLFSQEIPKYLKPCQNKIKIIDLSKCKKIHQEKFSFCLNEIKLIQYKNHLPVFIDNNNLSFDTNYFLTSDEDYIFTPNILYVAKSEAWDNDIFKIGIVNSICILKKRFQVYNTGRLKGKDFMLCVCIFPVLKPFELEKQLRHFLLKDYHLSNELYAIPMDLLISKLRPLSVPLIDKFNKEYNYK